MTHQAPPLRTATVPCQFCGTLNRVDLDRVASGPRCGSCRRPIMLDRPLAVRDESFDAVLAGSAVPVVVDFYADWCGPCRMMAPLLDDFAQQRAGAAVVLKLDTDRNPETSERYGVRSIPTLVVFEAGKEVGREVGVIPSERLNTLVPVPGKRVS